MKGELAAMGTAVCWAGTAVCFAAAGRRIGSGVVNRFRLLIAFPLLIALGLVVGVDWSIPTAQATLLAASGLIGLALGDAAYFEALVRIGPRRASLLMTLAPPCAAVAALVGLDNPLDLVGVAGMAITLAGVAWVISERSSDGVRRATAAGLALGAIGAGSQGLGIAVAKAGLGRAPADSLLGGWAGGHAAVELDPLLGTIARMAAAIVALLGLALLRGAPILPARDAPERGRAIAWTAAGALVGPALGVWLSLVAVAHTHAAVASTIMAISPVLVIPFAAVMEDERVSPRAVIGALIAVAGVATLAYRDAITAALGW